MAVDLNLETISSGFNTSKINTNFQRIDNALQDALSRSGENPNQMGADLDLNGNDILNVENVDTASLTIDGVPVTPGNAQVNPDTLVPAGGTTGQVLTKNSNTDYDDSWQSPVPGYTDEQAQDAVGNILVDTATIDFTYSDATPSIEASVKDGSINTTKLGGDITTAGKALLDDADAAAQRTTMFVQRRHSVDIMEFGASGVGVLDDGPEFNTAIATIDNVEGGELIISVPSDHYQLDTSVTITADNPVTLQGIGQPELRTNLAGQAIVVGSGAVSNQGFVSLRDFKLWGDASSVTGIKGNYAVNLELTGLSLYQLGTIGIYLDNCYTFRLDRSQFNDCGNAGIYLTGASMNSAVINRSKFLNHAGASECGINIEAGGSVHYGGLITDCDFEFNGNGIQAADISGLHISNCYFESNTKHINALTSCDNLKITDCQFLGTGYVDLSDVDGVTLDNLVFYGTGTVLDLTGCTNVTIGRLYFPNGGVVVGLDDQRLVGHYTAIDAALTQNPRLQVHTINSTRPAAALYRWSADNGGPTLGFVKSRGAAPGTNTIVQADDSTGAIIFRGTDGSGVWNSASIGAAIDGTPGSGDMPGRLVFNTAADGTTTLTERMRIAQNGFITIPNGSFGRAAPVTKTADFTVATTENWLINNKSGSTCTVTLPSASAFVGREIHFKNSQAQTVVSASSNVVPRVTAAAGTAILASGNGNWCTMVSDGTNWVIMQGS